MDLGKARKGRKRSGEAMSKGDSWRKEKTKVKNRRKEGDLLQGRSPNIIELAPTS